MGKVVRVRGQVELQIRRRLLDAIFEQRMPPGARLTEEALAETFDVSRTVIRQVIARLSQDGILIKRANGATHVAAPSKLEAKQILAVRSMIEPEVARSLASRAGGRAIVPLRAHLRAEDRARRAQDRGTLVRLTGEFHLRLVEMTENQVLIRLMTELQALVCLAILLYASGNDACPEDEHTAILDAIEAGHGELAADRMRHHLRHIEDDLKLDEEVRPEPRLTSTLDWLSSHWLATRNAV